MEYRNSSNGYYGGWLDGPEEGWAIADARDQRSALQPAEASDD